MACEEGGVCQIAEPSVFMHRCTQFSKPWVPDVPLLDCKPCPRGVGRRLDRRDLGATSDVPMEETLERQGVVREVEEPVQDLPLGLEDGLGEGQELSNI